MKKMLTILSVLLFIGAGCAIKENASKKQAETILYNADNWLVVFQLEKDLDGDGSMEKVLLLKTKEPVGSTGLGDAEYGVKLLITNAVAEKKFEVTPSEKRKVDNFYPSGYFRSEAGSQKNFYLEDLTGDGLPEVVFLTGASGVSDSSTCYNIVTFERPENSYSLVNEDEFCSTFNTGIEITDLTSQINGTEILKAIPSVGGVGGNKVEQSFKIEVYTWNGYGFRPYKSYKSIRKYEGGENAVKGELYNIQKSFWISSTTQPTEPTPTKPAVNTKLQLDQCLHQADETATNVFAIICASDDRFNGGTQQGKDACYNATSNDAIGFMYATAYRGAFEGVLTKRTIDRDECFKKYPQK